MAERSLKPGDVGFVPRYPPLDLSPFEARLKERREAATGIMNPATREVVESDTEMMRRLLLEVKNLRLGNAALKTVIDSMQLYRRPPT